MCVLSYVFVCACVCLCEMLRASVMGVTAAVQPHSLSEHTVTHLTQEALSCESAMLSLSSSIRAECTRFGTIFEG